MIEEMSHLRTLVYDAIFDPGMWMNVLAGAEMLTGASSATMIVFDSRVPLQFLSTDRARPLMERFVGEGLWKDSRRIEYFFEHPITGFVRADDYFPSAFLHTDAATALWAENGLTGQVGTIIPMPTGQIVVFAFERGRNDRAFSGPEIAALDALHADLARASLIGARLGQEQDALRLSTLSALGVPAAVLDASGGLRVANAAFEALEGLFATRAFNRIAVADRAANAIFTEALGAMSGAGAGFGPGVGDARAGTVRSIAVPGGPQRPPTLIHLMPLGAVGLDVFSRGRVIVAVSPLSSSGLVPSPTLLCGLFDLTPAEARLARWLAEGGSLKAASAAFGITEKTARTYLERIFRKTGTSSQVQLVAMLNSGPMPEPAADR
jgi:DNA-binding HTH domain-containing proteins